MEKGNERTDKHHVAFEVDLLVSAQSSRHSRGQDLDEKTVQNRRMAAICRTCDRVDLLN